MIVCCCCYFYIVFFRLLISFEFALLGPAIKGCLRQILSNNAIGKLCEIHIERLLKFRFLILITKLLADKLFNNYQFYTHFSALLLPVMETQDILIGCACSVQSKTKKKEEKREFKQKTTVLLTN